MFASLVELAWLFLPLLLLALLPSLPTTDGVPDRGDNQQHKGTNFKQTYKQWSLGK
jgi:hypothetical protein